MEVVEENDNSDTKITKEEIKEDEYSILVDEMGIKALFVNGIRSTCSRRVPVVTHRVVKSSIIGDDKQGVQEFINTFPCDNTCPEFCYKEEITHNGGVINERLKTLQTYCNGRIIDLKEVSYLPENK